MQRFSTISLRHSVLTALVLVTAALMGACTEEEVCEGEPMIMEFSASATTIAAGASVDLTVVVHNFILGEEHVHGSAPGTSADDSQGQGGVLFAHAGCLEGHAHIYLDDLMSNPIAMQTMRTAAVTIPAGTAAGQHTLIARLHTLDHLIVEPQVTKTLMIDVP